MEQWYKDAETEADAMLDAARLSARQPKTDELTSASEGVEALGQNMKLSVPQEFEDKAVSPQELQTVEDNFKTFAPTNPSEFFVPSVEKPDPLLTSFPSKREQINTARGKGYTDEQIALSMNRLELEQYTKGKTPAQIDELFGRTEETKALYDWQMKNLYADEMAFRLGLTKEDVLNRIDDARVLGVAPDLFLRDEDFWKQLCESSGVKTWRFGSLSEAAKTAAQIRLETDKSASLLWNSMTDPSMKDDSQLIAQLDKNGTLRHLQQGKTTNFFQDVAFSTADLWTQWVQSGLTGLKYLPAYTGAALAVGAKTGGLLNPFGAGAALGTGVAASLAHGAFEHTLKVESASEYATLRGMNVDKPTAALLALAGGAVKAGIEMNIFSRLSEYIPGMPKMDKFLSLPEGARSALAKLIQSEGVSPLVQIPTIRNALASRAKKYAADVGSNTVEEVMQDGVDILTEAIAAYLADNSNMPPQEAIRKLFSKENAARLAQTAAESAKTFAYGMLPAAAINAAGAGWSVRQVQKTPQAQRAEALNNWHAAQSHKGNGEQAGLSDVVFIPAEVFQQFNQGAADEQIGADETVAVESTGEVMMSRAAYEKLAAENEEFAKATASKVRVGAFGRTFEENAKILRESETDPLNDPDDEWAHEAREIRDEITQEMKDAGFDDATAEASGTIYAKNRLVRAVRLGTDELGIRRDGAKSPKQLRQIEIDNQRAQSERAGAEFQQNAFPYSLSRGQISFTSDGRSIVSLFERADRSTFFHEMGHFMLEELIQYGLDENATDEMKHDLAVAADYLGVGRLDLSRRNGQFNSAEAEQYRRAQEEFARSFEAYLMTGRAPTAEMTGLFDKLRRWLLDIYADVARLNVQLSPEIQDLFDRMLATPDEIDASRTTVAELANEDSLISGRLNELEHAHIPRVVSAMWDSAGLSDADIPDWVPPQLIHDSDPSEQSLRPELVKAVKKYGGIDYNSIVSMWGKGEAKELFDRDKSLFRKKGQKFDLLAQWLSEEGLPIADAYDLWNRLMEADPENANKELNVAIDETTLPWLFYLMTDEDVLRYAKTRERRLNKELKNLQSRDDHSELRTKGPEIYHELTLIGEIKKELNNTAKRAPKPSPDSDAWYTGEPAEFSPDMFTYEGTAEHESIPTQEAADKAAGVRRDAGETIALSDADRAAWKRAERFSRQAHRAGVKEERARGREQLREARKKERLAYKEGLRVQKEKEAALRAAQKKRKAQKDELNSILRAIKKAASDKQLSWGMKLKISEKLKDYTLSKPPRNRLEAAQQLKEYLEQTPEADMANFSPSDQRYIKILETTTLWDMTLEDVRQLGAEIKSMRQQGREEYDRWVLERDRRRDTGWNALMSSIGRTKANDGVSTVITSNDLKKHYASGIGGTLEKAKDWAYANTLGANRFFDWIGGGRKDYTSAWTQYFVDDVDTALDEELRWRQARYETMETRMKELKLSPKRLNEIRYVDGQAYPVDALIHIYAGLKNEHSRKAILYGNMGARFRKQGEAAAQEHAAHCVAALTEAEKALGDAVIADFSESFDRLNAAYIDAFNEGMTPEENYTPMKRLEYAALDLAGLRSDASEAELLEGQAVAAGSRNAVLQKGFLNDRMDISEENQQPIHLGLLSLWHDQVAAQEHTAAYGKLAGDLRSMLTKRDERGETLGRVIKQRFGSEALGYLREYTNIVIEGQAAKASEVMDGVSGYLGKNMAVAYLALNLGSVLKQFSSLPRFLVTAGPTHIFSALYDFMKGINPTGTNKLLDEVYALDPQMKNRSSDAFVQVMNDARKLTARQSVYKDMLELTMKPISYMDKVVACIGWKATYQSNIKRGLSHADAVREAKRAVALTQQTPLAKDMPRIWNQRGLARLFMLFTSDAANTWGMTVYDLAHGKGRDRLQTAAALALTALLIGYMQGGPDDDEEWIAWYMSQLAAQQIGSVPMAGKELMSAVELISRGYGNTTYSAISSPFIKLGMGLQSVFADDAAKRYADGATKRERGLFMALEGVSLLAEFPFTLVNRIRRMARSEDAADAARVMFGMRREARRGQRYRY